MTNVIKKDGSLESFDVKKIKQAITFSCEGLDVTPLALESKFDQFIVDGITTQSIHENLVEHAKQLCSASQPDWVLVAGRLHTMLHWSNTRSYEKDFLKFYRQQVDEGIWIHDGFDVYSDSDVVLLGQHLVKDRDLEHSYASVITAQTKYLLINECIQHMFMGNAMVIASVEPVETRIAFALEVYKALSERKLSLATPWLSGLRNGGNISSCFIIQPNDSLDSIYQSLWDAARISKAGGGLGIDLSLLRANGSFLMGYEGRAGGIAGWTKLYNDTAVTVNQAGKRKGAFTCALAIWHNDVSDFLDMQTEAGDQRKKAYDIKPQIVINDHFMVLKDNAKSKWYTFCPHETMTKLGLTLNGVFGRDFEAVYERCVQGYKDGVLKVVTVHKAKELFIRIMKNQFETGMPYITFSDTLNATNPNNHVGYIPCFNLCVAPETQILTSDGYQVISSLEDQMVGVWNGEQFSNVKVVKTGTNQRLLKVSTDFGHDLECTPYHKFYVQQGLSKGEVVEKRAYELKAGDKLIKHDLPIIAGTESLDKAYTNGFFTEDGTTDKASGKKMIYLYHGKRGLVNFIEHSGTWYEDDKQKRFVGNNVSGLKDKFFVPDATYTIKSRLGWLAGWFDAEGVVCRVGTNNSIQATSVELNFLKEVQLMLQTLGISSKICDLADEGSKDLPANDGTGESKSYFYQKSYRLLISSDGLYKLAELGFETHRLDWSKRLPQRDAECFVTVREVVDMGRVDTTFCFSEPLRHMGMFNGILTGQCTESTSVVLADETAHTCNLLSLVVGRIAKEDISRYAGLAAHILDNGIALTKPPIDKSRKHNESLRTIGIGIQGYHDYVANNWLSFSDVNAATELAERIQYGAMSQSIELAKSRGAYPLFKGSRWETGELTRTYALNSVCTDLSWGWLQSEMDKYGIRNSQLTSPAPNTSTSIFMDAAAGVMPVYSGFFYEDNGDGVLPVSSMHLKENPLSYMRGVTTYKPWELTKIVGGMQKFVDTGISAEYIMDKNQEGFTAKWLWDTVQQAWKNKTKAVYYIRTVKKGESLVKSGEDCAACSG